MIMEEGDDRRHNMNWIQPRVYSNKHEFNIDLIRLVRKYPELYDNMADRYKNNVYKQNLWTHIAEVLGCEDGKIVATRWRSMRDHFNKKRKNPSSDEAADNVDTYVYAGELNFLLPYLDRRIRSFPFIGKPMAEEEAEEQDDSGEWREEEQDEIVDTEKLHPSPSIAPMKLKLDRKCKKKLPMPNIFAEKRTPPSLKLHRTFPQTSTYQQQHQQPEDDEDGFYGRSLAQFMRHLPMKRKAQFRIEVEQLKLKYAPEG